MMIYEPGDHVSIAAEGEFPPPQDLVEQMYCSQQIHIPPTFPFILKQYCKAAIRTQPYDLLKWSTAYFRAMAEGDVPPVKPRLEFPATEVPSRLTPGYLRVLLRQLKRHKVVPTELLYTKWGGLCLNHNALKEMLQIGQFSKEEVDVIKFLSIAAAHLTSSLKETMIVICEILTEEPEGGSAMIPYTTFTELYTFLARLRCGPPGFYDEVCECKEEEVKDEESMSMSVSTVDEDEESLKEPPEEVTELVVQAALATIKEDDEMQQQSKEQIAGDITSETEEADKKEQPEKSEAEEEELPESELAPVSEDAEEEEQTTQNITEEEESQQLTEDKNEEELGEIETEAEELESEVDQGKEIEPIPDIENESEADDATAEKTTTAEEGEEASATEGTAEVTAESDTGEMVFADTDKEDVAEETATEAASEEVEEGPPTENQEVEIKEQHEEQHDEYPEKHPDEIHEQQAEEEKTQDEITEKISSYEIAKDAAEEMVSTASKIAETKGKATTAAATFLLIIKKEARKPKKRAVKKKVPPPPPPPPTVHYEVPGIGPRVPEEQIDKVLTFMQFWSARQEGMVAPRNINHFLCPPLDFVVPEDPDSIKVCRCDELSISVCYPGHPY